MRQLNKRHSEIRLSAFQVADELFNRSHAFRETLVNHLQTFLALTTETETEKPLPPPKSAAKKLKTDALHALQLWHDKYGQGYKKLSVGYNYLKNCKHVDFNDIRVQSQAERLRVETEEKRKKKIMADKLAKVLKDISEIKPEIADCAREAESCLQLLLPTLAEFILPVYEESAVIAKEQKTDVVGINASPGENKSNKEELHLLANGCCVESPSQIAATLKSSDSKDSCSENQHNQKPISDDRPDVNNSEISIQLDHTKPNSQAGLLPHEGSVDVQINEALRSACKPDVLEKETEGSGENESSDDSDTDDDAEAMDASEDNLYAHGLPNPSFNLVLELPAPGPISVQVTTDNRDVVCSLSGAIKLITNNYLPKVIKWLEVLGKNGAKSEDIKAAIDLKRNLEDIKMKCKELNLVTMEPEKLQEADISDDDEFEEVPEKEGYEPRIPQHLRAEYGLDTLPVKPRPSMSSMKQKDSSHLAVETVESEKNKSASTSKLWSLKDRISTDDVADPTSLAAALANIKRKSSEIATTSSSASSGVQNLNGQGTSTAPVVSFGSDLAYWENPDQIEAPTVVKLDSLHRFWAPKETESEKPSQHDIAAVKNRVFYFTGNFEPVKWKCRAVMPNGKLCDRMDRVKCPFHGKIVPRDKSGKPNGENHPSSSDIGEVKSEVLEKHDEELPPWQDPELQRDIEQATGHDLGSARSQKLLDKKSKGKGKGKGKKKSNLTNIEATKNTTRKRLEDRIFNKGSLKRVCSTLDNADYKRVRDKFANQFHYSMRS
ncbi:hypothetical protein BsWGS_01048 [Bradybaena similaris]